MEIAWLTSETVVASVSLIILFECSDWLEHPQRIQARVARVSEELQGFAWNSNALKKNKQCLKLLRKMRTLGN